MKFLSEALRGDLILIKTRNTPTPARAVIARRATPAVDSLLIRLILWLCVAIGRPAMATVRSVRRAWPPITPEALPVLKLGFVFLLVVIGTIAAMLAARG